MGSKPLSVATKVAYLTRLSVFAALAITDASCSHGAYPSSFGPPISSGVAPQTDALEKYRVVFNFGSSVYGYYGSTPRAGLIAVTGTLYGTTSFGGVDTSHFAYGTVYSITPAGYESVLHSFTGTDGAFPAARLLDVNGTLYGTTGGNAVYGKRYGDGTVFSISKGGSNFRVLHTFEGGSSDGAYPLAGLVVAHGKLYGTTFQGGAFNGGTVFRIDISTEKERILHNFGSGSDGSLPLSDLIDVGGTLYGTTEIGGTSDVGTVFSITPTGKEVVLHNFSGPPDGGAPMAGLVYIKGVFYGTTSQGGAYYQSGTVFSVTAAGTERVVHSFSNRGSDGANPIAALAPVAGLLYGTTLNGGAANLGTVFRISPTGEELVLHSFAGYPNDGEYPYASLSLLKHTLYGTTYQGGVSLPSCQSSGPCDYGVVFALPQ